MKGQVLKLGEKEEVGFLEFVFYEELETVYKTYYYVKENNSQKEEKTLDFHIGLYVDKDGILRLPSLILKVNTEKKHLNIISINHSAEISVVALVSKTAKGEKRKKNNAVPELKDAKSRASTWIKIAYDIASQLGCERLTLQDAARDNFIDPGSNATIGTIEKHHYNIIAHETRAKNYEHELSKSTDEILALPYGIIRDHEMENETFYRIVKVNEYTENLKKAKFEEIKKGAIFLTPKLRPDYEARQDECLVEKVDIKEVFPETDVSKIKKNQYYKIIDLGVGDDDTIKEWESLGAPNPSVNMEFISLKNGRPTFKKGKDMKVQRLELSAVSKSPQTLIERGETFYGTYGFRPYYFTDHHDTMYSRSIAKVYNTLFPEIMNELNYKEKDLLVDTDVSKFDIQDIVSELNKRHKVTKEKVSAIKSHSKFNKFKELRGKQRYNESDEAKIAQEILLIANRSKDLTVGYLEETKDTYQRAAFESIKSQFSSYKFDFNHEKTMKDLFVFVKNQLKSSQKSKEEITLILDNLASLILDLVGLVSYDLNMFYELLIEDEINEKLDILQVISMEGATESKEENIDEDYKKEMEVLEKIKEEYKPEFNDTF